MRPIVIFYHIYAVNNWEEIVREQLEKLYISRLYGECLAMFVSFTGGEQESKIYRSLIKDYRKIHTFKEDDINTRERGTLNAIRTLAFETFPMREKAGLDVYVLYLHTKGVSSSESLKVKNLKEKMRDWRNMMEFFLIDNWRKCVSFLEDYDAVGCNYRMQDLFGKKVGHFSGNFWWCRLSYVFKNLEALDYDLDVAYDEFWVGLGSPNVKILHESGVDHYLHIYPEEKYKQISFVE